jgi:hypothetical protein
MHICITCFDLAKGFSAHELGFYGSLENFIILLKTPVHMWYCLFSPIDLFCLVLQAWEAASKAVKDEEAIKQKLCEDLSQLVDVSCLMCVSMVTA